MLAQTRLALRITTNAYDAELAALIKAAATDLRIAGVPVDGISFNISETGSRLVVTDACTLEDDIIIRAIITYVRAHFGSPEDYDRLKAAYDEQKAQLQTATGYGMEAAE